MAAVEADDQPDLHSFVRSIKRDYNTVHLGELTQQLPFEMVDAVLEQICWLQHRVRDLPARVVVYRCWPDACSPSWATRRSGADWRRGGATGGSSYPQLRLVALVSRGTRTIIDAVFGPTSSGETAYAADLLRSLHAGMLLLADRYFGSGALAAQVAATKADFLIPSG
jgi:hypothetical protein